MKINKQKYRFIKRALEVNRDSLIITRKEISKMVTQENFEWPNWLLNNRQFRVSRGVYRLPDLPETEPRK